MAVKKRLGEMLVEAGVIDETQLHAALGHQRKWGGKLGQALQDLKLATEAQIVAALSRKFGYGAVKVAALPRTPQLESALKLVPRELAMRQTLLPIACDTSSVTVAMGDPSNIAVVDELSFRTGRRIKIALAGDREIAAAVRRLYFAEEEPSPVAAIPLDELSGDSLVETTRDAFAAMPGHVREGYFAGAETAPAAPPRVDVQPTFTPPPVLLRERSLPPVPPVPPVRPGRPVASPAGTPGPGAPLAPVPSTPEDILGEPILATDLAPEQDSADGMPVELSPRQAAMLDALERAARGEDSGLVKPAQLAAALARLLVKHGIVTETELLDALVKK